MKNSLAILACFLAGLAAGALELAPAWLRHPDASFYALVILLFLVGVTVGSDTKAWEIVRKAQARVLLIPVAVVCGTLMGAVLVAPLIVNLAVHEALAVGSGLGYYSLSSILITELHGERLGIVALLANILRELITLALAPLLVRYWGKLAPIAAGAATTMDTTLPVITRTSGSEYATIAVFSGVTLMVLTPLLITLFLSFGH